MKSKFEEFLKEWHAEDYIGTDDDMPEAFDAWLESLEPQTLMMLADAAMEKAHLAGFREAKEIISPTMTS
jgi:hypothetical protein